MRKNARKTLTLGRETLRALADEQLRAANGGVDIKTQLFCTMSCYTRCFSRDPYTDCCLEIP